MELLLPPRLERGRGAGRVRRRPRAQRPAARPARSTTASPPRSCTAPPRGGVTGSKARSRTGAGTRCSPTGTSRRSSRCSEPRPPDCRSATPPTRWQVEQAYWETLLRVRALLETDPVAPAAAAAVAGAATRLDRRGRRPRAGAPAIERVYRDLDPGVVPAGLELAPGTSIALRQQLGKVMGHLNQVSGGGVLIAAADLLGFDRDPGRRRRVPRRVLSPRRQPGLTHHVVRDLRGRSHVGDDRGLWIRSPHRGRSFVRGLYRSARAHRGAGTRHQRRDAPAHRSRPVAPGDPGGRSRRDEDR